MLTAPDVSIVLPCYRETEHLRDSFAAIWAMLQHLRARWEVILIDDASGDGTADILAEIGREHPECRVSCHETNLGRGGTVAEGIRLARGRIAGYFDVDIEVSPCHLLHVLSAFAEDRCDVLVARRAYHTQLTPLSIARQVCHLAYRRLSRSLIGVPVADSEAGFKFFNREKILPVLDQVRDARWFWDTEVLVRAHRAGLRIAEFNCLYHRNLGKTSTVRLVRDSIEYLRQLRRLRRELRAAGGAQ